MRKKVPEVGGKKSGRTIKAETLIEIVIIPVPVPFCSGSGAFGDDMQHRPLSSK
jgi:hypothetical protein